MKKIIIIIILVTMLLALFGCVQDSGSTNSTPTQKIVTEKIIVAGQNGQISQSGANGSVLDITPQYINLSLGVNYLKIQLMQLTTGTISVYLPNTTTGGDFWRVFNTTINDYDMDSSQNQPFNLNSFNIQCSPDFTGVLEIDLSQYVPISGSSN